MLSCLQRAVLGALVSGTLGLCAFLIAIGRPTLAAAAAALLVFGHGLVLAVEFMLLLWVRRSDSAPRASALDLLRAWSGECVWSWRVFCWEQPFRADRWPDLMAPHGRHGLVFVHGYFCNRGFWNPWLARCHSEGRPFIAVNLEPVFGGLSDYGEQIDAAVVRIEAATGLAPVLVGHSMGGLVLRAWLAAHPLNVERVHHVFTIATPHRGTWMARWSRTSNARAMRPGSSWLAALAQRERTSNEIGGRLLRTCFWGHADNMVMPPSAALWRDAAARHVHATAHVAMAFQAAVSAEVSRALDRGSITSSSGSRSSVDDAPSEGSL